MTPANGLAAPHGKPGAQRGPMAADARWRPFAILVLGAGCFVVAASLTPAGPSGSAAHAPPELRAWCGVLAAACVCLRLPLLKSAPGGEPRGHRAAWLAAAAWVAAAWWIGPSRPGLAWCALAMALAAALFASGGRTWLRVAAPGLLVLVAPVAFSALEGRTSPVLQESAARSSHVFYRSYLSGQCERDGFVLRFLPGAGSGRPAVPVVLKVAPECGGYRSICGMALATAVFAAHPAVSGLGKLLMGVTAAALAVGLNLLRLAVTLWLYDTGRARLARGGAHALLGQLVLAVGIGVLFVAFRLLLRGRQPSNPHATRR